ncbi:hypothetical protein KAJ27_12385 [bacterium]|nr:hypothetical protein [bacterium]
MSTKTAERIRETLNFHKKTAPGIYLAVIMLELAEKKFNIKEKSNYVMETHFCIPDPIQILKGATLGNRYIRHEIQSGRFAFTVFNRDTKKGLRVYVDSKKIDREKMPYFYEFYFRCRDLSSLTREEHNKFVIEEIKKLGENMISSQEVMVNLDEKEPMKRTDLCTKCGEVFLLNYEDQKICGECEKGKDSYYTVL